MGALPPIFSKQNTKRARCAEKVNSIYNSHVQKMQMTETKIKHKILTNRFKQFVNDLL